MSAYYNENEAYPAQWLRNLIKAGLIAPGYVDERSVVDVEPLDLAGFTQCHWFAGIGIWSYALRQAGWPDDRPVWSGSCPCQPGSVAGKQEGFEDPRHLWPAWFNLIRQCRPSVLIGEQTSNWAAWLQLVSSDLEKMGFAFGAMPIEAASAGAYHYRDRYWFVAHANDAERWSERPGGNEHLRSPSRRVEIDGDAPERRPEDRRGGVANGHESEFRSEPPTRQLAQLQQDSRDRDSRLADGDFTRSQGRIELAHGAAERSSQACCAGDRTGGLVNGASVGWGEGWTESELRSRGFAAAVASIDGVQVFECPDGKWRALPPPGVSWMGNGVAARISKIRAIGNAIDPRPATAFIKAAMECLP